VFEVARIGVDFRHDPARHLQAAAVNRLVISHAPMIIGAFHCTAGAVRCM
jgi:hypothetical protein